MATTKEYTVRQSVRDALTSIPYDSDFKGYDFLNKCRRNLFIHGSKAKPYDSTLLRDLRRYRGEFKITVKDRNKSIYHKGAV